MGLKGLWLPEAARLALISSNIIIHGQIASDDYMFHSDQVDWNPHLHMTAGNDAFSGPN